MDSAQLEKLPLAILQQIAGYLHDTHRPSLYLFGLACRACQMAALPSIFREVHLTVRSREALQYDVDALTKVLSGAASARYVRHLNLKGFLLLNIDKPDDPGKEARTSNADGNDDVDMDWFHHGVGEVLGNEKPYVRWPRIPDDPIEVTPEEDIAWAPVVHLAKTLPHLTKLVYDCRNQFPPSLLEALHKHQPQCKLYHLTFRLPSLRSLRSLRYKTIYLHDMAIATSPCLYSIKIEYAKIDSTSEDDFHDIAIPEFVAGLAPNLKEVSMVKFMPYPTQNTYRRRILQELWQGLRGFVPGRGIGLLTSLSIAGFVKFTSDFFQTWNQYIDFSSLNHLALGRSYSDYHPGIEGEVMDWIIQNCSLPRLKTLYIRLNRGEREEAKPNYTNSAINFFKSLEPLHGLSVDGPLEPKILDTILSQHGHALKKLSLSPFEAQHCYPQYIPSRHIPMIFEKEHILQIQTQCPELQDLAISVKRTKSDIRETEIYKSFGKMERLQVLFLTLDCSNWRVYRGNTSTDDPSFDEEDRKLFYNFHEDEPLKRGHIREAFINCAVDETLARSIWKTICRDKAGKRLDSLKLYTTGGSNFGKPGRCSIRNIVDHLSRSWLIEKSIRDDKDIINIRELGRRARETRDKQEIALHNKLYKGDRAWLDDLYHLPEHIFRRIWPIKDDSTDWRQDWASFPLPG